MIDKNFILFKRNKTLNNKAFLEEADKCAETIQGLNLYEVKLNKVYSKLNSLEILAFKIKEENEKTNKVMMQQENNFKNIDNIIQKQTNIINKLSEDINVYKINLDNNIKNFSSNKDKLLNMVSFIMEIKEYIADIEKSSNNMRNKSDSILNISKTIKKIADNSKMLSINAQIEAAKFYDKNNGFGVISSEMVRMSSDTVQNSILIDNTVNIIIKDIESLNKNIHLNVHKIEESIALCEVIFDFVESLSNEYKSNIEMFNRILNSMNEIIMFIDDTKESINKGYEIANNVFRNTSSEYVAIEGFMEESLLCKKESILNSDSIDKESIIDTNETLDILIRKYKDFNTDPLAILYESEMAICNNIYDRLFKESKAGTAIPVLAKGWQDEECKVWTIYLRDNIYFSSGKLFTAEDVEFAFIRSCVKNVYQSHETLNMIEGYRIFDTEKEAFENKISGIKVLNKHTIQLKLKEPNILFLSKLASNNLNIISKHDYIKEQKVVGTGAYAVDNIHKINKNLEIISLKANNFNFRASPYIKNIRITHISNFEDYFKDRKLEQFDIINYVPLLEINNLVNEYPDYLIESIYTHSMVLVNFISDSKNKLVQNKDFRQTVLSLIKSIDLNISSGIEYFNNYNALSPYWRNNNETIPDWISDVPIIKRLSGTLNITTYDDWFTIELVNKIKKQLEQYGLHVNIIIDNEQSNQENVDMVVSVLLFDVNDSYSQIYDSISSPFGSCLINKPIGEKLKKISDVPNYKQKIELLKNIEIEILKEYYNLPLCSMKSFYLRHKKVLNLSNNNENNLLYENILKFKE